MRGMRCMTPGIRLIEGVGGQQKQIFAQHGSALTREDDPNCLSADLSERGTRWEWATNILGCSVQASKAFWPHCTERSSIASQPGSFSRGRRHPDSSTIQHVFVCFTPTTAGRSEYGDTYFAFFLHTQIFLLFHNPSSTSLGQLPPTAGLELDTPLCTRQDQPNDL